MGLFGGKKRDNWPRANAQVVAVFKPIERARYVNCKLDLVVHPSGAAPFQGSAKKKALRWNRVPEPGMTIPVICNPNDPTDFDVVWDELLDHDEMIAARSQQIITDSPGHAAPHSSSTTEPSRVEMLERLAALHRSGALSDAEFAAEKQRLMHD